MPWTFLNPPKKKKQIKIYYFVTYPYNGVIDTINYYFIISTYLNREFIFKTVNLIKSIVYYITNNINIKAKRYLWTIFLIKQKQIKNTK